MTPHHDEEFDRHRRRVLWALPTGLYLVGSRAGDEVNLMTANLVVQVCVEPKVVAVALEHGSVTVRLVREGRAFAISLLLSCRTGWDWREGPRLQAVPPFPAPTGSPPPVARAARGPSVQSIAPSAPWLGRSARLSDLMSFNRLNHT